MNDTDTAYAWCFSHGVLHWFSLDNKWCTAEWVPLDGDTRATALQDKVARYGDARFLGELPFETQVEITQATP